MQLVREAAATDGAGNNEAWAGANREQLKGQTLLPQWKARRIGLNKYEVAYEFTLVDPSNRVRHISYNWEADLALRTVSAPRLVDQPGKTSHKPEPR